MVALLIGRSADPGPSIRLPQIPRWLRMSRPGRWHTAPHHDPTSRPRRPLGGHRALPTRAAAEAAGRSSPSPRPRRARRHHLRPAYRHAMAAPAEGIGLRERRDLLAQAARLAAGRHLGSPPPAGAELARGGPNHRLVA